jgi:splicing factor 3A subunit 1
MQERDAAAAAQAAAQAAAKPGAQPQMRIRSDYVPRAQQARRANTAGTTALCPNCGQQIPVNELEQHMRIELLDPRWKEQRAKADSRAATTNLSTVDVVNNLKRFASQRTDVFDAPVPAAAPPASNPEMDEEEARRKRLATGNGYPPQPGLAPGYPPATGAAAVPGLPPPPPGVLSPGYPADPNNMPPPGVGPAVLPPGTGPQPQAMSIHEQIRNIHERYGTSNPPPPPGASQ